MKKLYEKSEIWFAVIWIVIYVAVMGNLRANFGDGSVYSLIGVFAVSLLLTVFIVKNKLCKKYGLTFFSDGKTYLYFVPFILLCSVNLWNGFSLHDDIPHQITAVLVMALVGYTEEIIFRGLLFKAIEKGSTKRAIIISAVTFGAGHIVNLLTGHASLDVLLQIAYATAIGFSFVMVFYKSGSLLPCIMTHSIINMTSEFSKTDLPEKTEALFGYISCVFILIVAGGYALYIHKKVHTTKTEE